MHPTSLPGREGIGTFGDEARQFVNLLAEAHVGLWQMLPLGPTGYGDSPYATRSSHAGNELLIDLTDLAAEGLLDLKDLLDAPHFNTKRVDYGKVRQWKRPLLLKAARNFLADKEGQEAFKAFCAKEAWWLDDWALYITLCEVYGDSRWFCAWPKPVKMRDARTLAALKTQYAGQILLEKVIQYFFHLQATALKHYANNRGVRIIGDIPIFVAGDSVDVWKDRWLFKLDAQGNQKVSSGVPPDAFSADGQLWGNPIYDWKAHQKEGWQWWTRRIQKALEYSDILRIDHFRGFAACWEVPAKDTTARNGKWVKAPGEEFFQHLHEVLGEDLPFIAEDLGVITPDVEKLRDENRLPGMKILQFAFGLDRQGRLDTTNPYLLHNCTKDSVVYTGTHDNNTTLGWFKSLDDGTRDKVRRYLECPDDQVVWQLVRLGMMSPSKYAIFPMQDWLTLDGDARMNVPATCGGSNWSWRAESLDLEGWRIGRMRDLIDIYGRWSDEHHPL